ncbi:NYN domain-containing protein [Synechococcales cyanobacterium C]|uniref:NYN domain-containing protein n=2 Tax=Petrachloros TaxID=2918834 RepID=A0A8K2A0X7_9CYAN|nr:NYN domain-containing protein [Petrachloros mirabilis ULC683]
MKKLSKTKIDYAKLLQLVQSEATAVRAFAYTAQDDYNVGNLRQLGYTVITKPKVQQSDHREKCNVDLEIAFKIIELTFKRAYDTLVLASGDSDFMVAVNLIHRARLRVELLSHSEDTSPQLIQLADRYLDLRQLEAKLAET